MLGHFRLKIRQFLFASFNRIGYKLCESHDLEKIISHENIIYLCTKAGKRDEQTFIHAFLPEQKLFTISCITPAKTSSQNRTFIIRTADLEEALRPLLTEAIPINPPKELKEINVTLEIE